jgi:alpha-galactosidase
MQNSEDFIPYSRRPLPERPRIVFFGNSITLHSPNHHIDWPDYHGMAASAEERDYAHVLTRLLGLPDDEAHIVNLSCFEAGFVGSRTHLAPVEAALARTPRFVIVALGDNLFLQFRRPLESSRNAWTFAANYRAILARAEASGARIVCASSWWRSPAKDLLIRSIARRYGARYVFIGDIFAREMAGKDRNDLRRPFVDTHPGDSGMQEIATRLWKALGASAAHSEPDARPFSTRS